MVSKSEQRAAVRCGRLQRKPQPICGFRRDPDGRSAPPPALRPLDSALCQLRAPSAVGPDWWFAGLRLKRNRPGEKNVEYESWGRNI